MREKRRRQRQRRTHSNEDGEEQTRFRWGSNDERDTLEELRHEELGDEGVGVAVGKEGRRTDRRRVSFRSTPLAGESKEGEREKKMKLTNAKRPVSGTA